MNGMKVDPLGLDDRLPCAVYLPPSLCLGLGTTVRTLLTALAQRRRWVEEGKLRGDLIQVPPDPAEKLAKMWGELAKKDAEIERLRGSLSNLVAAVDDLISESEGVYGLRLNGDPSLWEELTEVGWLLALEEAKAALDGEKEARAAVTAMKGERDDDAAQDAGGHTGMSESRHQGRVR